jgi:hypothetical protein
MVVVGFSMFVLRLSEAARKSEANVHQTRRGVKKAKHIKFVSFFCIPIHRHRSISVYIYRMTRNFNLNYGEPAITIIPAYNEEEHISKRVYDHASNLNLQSKRWRR